MEWPEREEAGETVATFALCRKLRDVGGQGGKIMNKGIAIALLVGGIVLAIFGISAADSFSSDVSRFFTGKPTDKAVWMLIGGIVAAVAGLFGLMRGARA